MAAKKRDIVTEIAAIRARSFRFAGTTPWRMGRLRSAFTEDAQLDQELLRYFPVGIVACVEGFFRQAIKELLDSGGPFYQRFASSAQSKDLKLDLEVIAAITGQTVTVGEIAAHHLPLSSLDPIESIMAVLLGSFVPRCVEGDARSLEGGGPEEAAATDHIPT